MLANVLTVLAAPILSRIYAPEAFGTAAVFTSVVSIVAVIACLRYELAILLPKHDEEAANVLGVSLCSVLAISGISMIMVISVRTLIIRLLHAPELVPYIWLVPLAVFATGMFQALNYWNSRTKHFGRLSVARVSMSVTTNGAQLGMGVFGQTHTGGLIGASVIGSAVSAAALGTFTWREDCRLFLRNIRLRRMLDSLVRYRKFPLVDSWGGAINSLSWQLPPLMLSAFFSQATVGQYSQAYRLIHLPMSLMGAAIAQVFFQRASEARSKQEDMASLTAMVFQRLVALSLFPCLLMAIVGREAFVVLLGQNWLDAGTYVQILSPWAFFWLISSPLSMLFIIFERQELALIVHIAILVTRAVSLVVGGMLGNVYLALGLFAGSGVIVYGGLTFWNMTLAGVTLRRSLQLLLKQSLYCVPLGLAVIFAKVLWATSAPLVLGASAAALLIYYLLVLRVDQVLYRYLRERFLRSG